MTVKMKKGKPRGEGVFLVKDYSGTIDLIYIQNRFVFDYPEMNSSQPLEEVACWMEYSSPKLNLELIS
jgi:hypothetical protein